MKFVRAALFAVAATVTAFTFAGISAQPADARCNFNSGMCAKKGPSPGVATIEEMVLAPDDSWNGDGDCQYYGSCH